MSQQSGNPGQPTRPDLPEPISQGGQGTWYPSGVSKLIPMWIRQLPSLRFPRRQNEAFELISDEFLHQIATTYQLDEAALEKIKQDRDFMEPELMVYFRELDHKAKLQQNGYRLFQLSILALATLATIIGSLQAVMLSSNPDILPWLGALEAFVALLTVFVVQTRGTNSRLSDWLNNRRKAEQMRREFFRYLMDLPPYRSIEVDYERKQTLSRRAAEIYNDKFPEEPSILEGRAM
ncbi:MAG: DUF4231 domain-containing protein [Chloroflexi bacterium]|nr:MAG: DUF4231 domain-containing protein [Chloroflexota bacterium]